MANSNITTHQIDDSLDNLSLDEIVKRVNANRLPTKIFETEKFSIDTILNNPRDNDTLTLRDRIGDKSYILLSKRKEIVYDTNNELWDKEWAEVYAATMVADMDGIRYEELFAGKLLRAILLKKIIQSHLKSFTEKPVYEIGGGTGFTLRKMLKEGAIVHNYDQSEIALDYFKYLCSSYTSNHCLSIYKQAEIGKRIIAIRGTFQELPSNISDNASMATFNLGVFEHLDENEKLSLMSEMVRITDHGGIVLVAVPNMAGPHYNEMRKRENLYHKWAKIESPMEINTDINLAQMMEKYGLEVISDGGLLIAPSTPITKEYFRTHQRPVNEEDRRLFSLIINAKDIGDRIRLYQLLENYATSEQKKRLGQYIYTVGLKN